MDAVDKSPQFYPVEWKDVKDRVSELQPRLAVAIDRLASEEKALPLYYARYPYGSLILDNTGTLNLPIDGKLVPITAQECPKAFKDALGYSNNAMPLSLILNGSLDIFMQDPSDAIETFVVYKPKTVLALQRVLDPESSYHLRKSWRVCSGSRTPMMLPSISNRVQFDKLRRKYGLQTNKPDSQHDHWQLFRSLANCSDFKTPWFTEMLFFSRDWLTPKPSDAWQLFHHELLNIAWEATAYARNSKLIERVWTSFIQSLRNKRATPYVISLLKHIIEVSLKEVPAYSVFNGQDQRGPFNEITDILFNDYGLGQSAPLIVETNYYDENGENDTLISLKFLTHPWTEATPFENLSMMSHLRETQYLLSQFIDYLQLDKLETADTPLARLQKIHYGFYHYSQDPHDELQVSHLAFENNPFAQAICKKYDAYDLPRSPKNEFLSSFILLSNI